MEIIEPAFKNYKPVCHTARAIKLTPENLIQVCAYIYFRLGGDITYTATGTADTPEQRFTISGYDGDQVCSSMGSWLVEDAHGFNHGWYMVSDHYMNNNYTEDPSVGCGQGYGVGSDNIGRKLPFGLPMVMGR